MFQQLIPMRKTILSILTTAVVTGFFSCTWEHIVPDGELTDAKLYQLAADSTGHVYYQNGNILPPAGGSPHGNFRLRFNPKAASVLDSILELPVGQTFPDSSLLVKEALNSSGAVSVYAVMYKYNGSWAWAEYGPSGNTLFTLTANGSSCIPCHSGGTNRDLVRTFDAH